MYRFSAKKTAWGNFKEICDIIGREKEHLSQFVFAELGCDGMFTGDEQFILKGRFFPKNIETLLRRYIKEYVTCHMCKSAKTLLVKDHGARLMNMNCNNCGATRSCVNIQKGFKNAAKGSRRREKIAGTKVGQVTA